MSKYKVYFATGSRADYGIVRNYLRYLNEDKRIDLSLLVTGALLSFEYGHQVELIYQDGFSIAKEIEILINPTSNKDITRSMAVALEKFGEYFCDNKPDLLIVLGDRYEILSVVISAAMNRIPILHIHGGELTYGNYDEFIRHSITKMSLFHFTATEEYRKRVIQLGEAPNRVFYLGALGAENCLHIDEKLVPEKVCSLKDEMYFVVLFHPETITKTSVANQIEIVLSAISKYKKYKFVFLGTNADTHSDIIRNAVKEYLSASVNCLYFENLTTAGYHYLLKYAKALIGNSSSGLIEAPSLGTYTINIGDRQAGRVRGNSVVDVSCDVSDICNAIDYVISFSCTDNIINPYHKINTADNYYHKTIDILEELEKNCVDIPKKFYDL